MSKLIIFLCYVAHSLLNTMYTSISVFSFKIEIFFIVSCYHNWWNFVIVWEILWYSFCTCTNQFFLLLYFSTRRYTWLMNIVLTFLGHIVPLPTTASGCYQTYFHLWNILYSLNWKYAEVLKVVVLLGRLRIPIVILNINKHYSWENLIHFQELLGVNFKVLLGKCSNELKWSRSDSMLEDHSI